VIAFLSVNRIFGSNVAAVALTGARLGTSGPPWRLLGALTGRRSAFVYGHNAPRMTGQAVAAMAALYPGRLGFVGRWPFARKPFTQGHGSTHVLSPSPPHTVIASASICHSRCNSKSSSSG
jgi:hypothetical protein